MPQQDNSTMAAMSVGIDQDDGWIPHWHKEHSFFVGYKDGSITSISRAKGSQLKEQYRGSVIVINTYR